MSSTTITHKGSHHTFECTETTWKLYENLIRAYCSGKILQTRHPMTGEWVDLSEEINPYSLHEYRVKPKDKSKSAVKVGQVWKDGLTDALFVITKETESKGVVFWLESSRFSWTGFSPDAIVNKHYSVKVAESVESYYKEKLEGV